MVDEKLMNRFIHGLYKPTLENFLFIASQCQTFNHVHMLVISFKDSMMILQTTTKMVTNPRGKISCSHGHASHAQTQTRSSRKTIYIVSCLVMDFRNNSLYMRTLHIAQNHAIYNAMALKWGLIKTLSSQTLMVTPC